MNLTMSRFMNIVSIYTSQIEKTVIGLGKFYHEMKFCKELPHTQVLENWLQFYMLCSQLEISEGKISNELFMEHWNDEHGRML